MQKNTILKIFSIAGALALAIAIWPKVEKENFVQIEQVEEESFSSSEETTLYKPTTQNKKTNPKSKKEPHESTAQKNLDPEVFSKPAFKTYRKLFTKVVLKPDERESFNQSLKDPETLNGLADYLTSNTKSPGPSEKINHLKASAFILKALNTHPNNPSVQTAIKEVLKVNLSDAKASLGDEAYQLLKENKAEVLYHALAVSEDIKNTYSADSSDLESLKIYNVVQSFHNKNVAISNQMIADRKN